jgi:hypothetical protein
MPSWRDLERFLLHDGWEYLPRTSGTDKSYSKMLRTGEVLWMRVSKNSGQIGPKLFAQILKRQVKSSKEYFNKALSNKKSSSDDPIERMK